MIMVWAGISADQKTNFHFVRGRLNGNAYRDTILAPLGGSSHDTTRVTAVSAGQRTGACGKSLHRLLTPAAHQRLTVTVA